MSQTASLMDLMDEISEMGRWSSEYYTKMIHKIPKAAVVDRDKFIMAKCHDKRVVNFGSASGVLHAEIKSVAKSVYGIDKVEPADALMDLDDEHCPLHGLPESDVYVCGELIEHLANPGMFLKKVHWSMEHEAAKNAELIITVPNALSEVVQYHAKRGIENVNDTHFCWYSHKTLDTLLRRHKYEPKGLCWYKGRPVFAEGLIMMAVPS